MKSANIEDFESMAAMLKVLAHPTRLGILYLLEKISQMSVSDLMEALDCEQSYISQHLRQLKLRGILGTKREGKFVFYFLKEKSCGGLVKVFDKMEIKINYS